MLRSVHFFINIAWNFTSPFNLQNQIFLQYIHTFFYVNLRIHVSEWSKGEKIKMRVNTNRLEFFSKLFRCYIFPIKRNISSFLLKYFWNLTHSTFMILSFMYYSLLYVFEDVSWTSLEIYSQKSFRKFP